MEKVLYLYEDYFVLNGIKFFKHELQDSYLAQNLSKKELMNQYQTSKSTIERILHYYNIQKDKKQANKIAQDTMLKKYGVKSYTLTEEYKKSYHETCLKKYGTFFHTQSKNTKNKYKETCLLKYGTVTTAVLPENIKKRQETCLVKYGVDNPAKAENIKIKTKQTNLNKYGQESFLKTNEFKEKAHQTCLDKYGIDSFSKTAGFKAKMSEIMKNKKEDQWSSFCKQVLDSKENFIAFLQKENHKPTVIEIAEKLGCSISTIGERLRKWDLYSYFNLSCSTSSYEKEIQEFLNGLGVFMVKNRKILDGLEIDLYNEEYKLGIEFNGTYWHSYEMLNDKNYHLNKSKLAESKGIRLIHIYEYEWNDLYKKSLIQSLLKIAVNKVDSKIYARKCKIQEITNIEARDFNEKNHLQGHRNAQITYGLFYNDQLVQLMSFSKTKYNRNLKEDNEWEIIRGCPGSNNIVVGGVSKLFKHFIKEQKPSKVFSYCDFNKFNGVGYESIGMKFAGYTGPDMKWILKDRTVVNRQPYKHAELKKEAIGQIFGAGSKKYIWTKD
jgi:hypothetical protein